MGIGLCFCVAVGLGVGVDVGGAFFDVVEVGVTEFCCVAVKAMLADCPDGDAAGEGIFCCSNFVNNVDAVVEAIWYPSSKMGMDTIAAIPNIQYRNRPIKQVKWIDCHSGNLRSQRGQI